MFTKFFPPEKHTVMKGLIGVHTLQSRGSVEEVIEDGEQVEDHALIMMERQHGVKKGGQHGCRDGTILVQNGSLKK